MERLISNNKNPFRKLENFDYSLKSQPNKSGFIRYKGKNLFNLASNDYLGLSFDKELIVPWNKDFSAMQRATAFPISSVASIMAEGHFDDLKTVAYKDIPFEKFNENLDSIGISTLE